MSLSIGLPGSNLVLDTVQTVLTAWRRKPGTDTAGIRKQRYSILLLLALLESAGYGWKRYGCAESKPG